MFNKLLKKLEVYIDSKLNKNVYIDDLYDLLLLEKRKNPEIEKLFSEKVFEKHYVYEPMRNSKKHPDLFINQIRYFRMYEFFKKNYPSIFEKNTLVGDIGDTSGIFLSAINPSGISVSINQECVNYMNDNGKRAVLGNIEKLPFEDKYLDYSFSFQCIEHVLNPVNALNELSRVTKNYVFVSIPYVNETKIYDLKYWINKKTDTVENGGWDESEVKEVDTHFIEFSTKDFIKVLSHTNLEYVDNFPINYFNKLGELKERKNAYHNFFVLKPKDKSIYKEYF